MDKIDTLDKRVNVVEREQSAHCVEIKELNKKNDNVWESIKELRDTINKVIIKTSLIYGGIMVLGVLGTYVIQIYISTHN